MRSFFLNKTTVFGLQVYVTNIFYTINKKGTYEKAP